MDESDDIVTRLPLNDMAARARLATIVDPVVRNLVSMAFGAAMVQLLRPDGMTDEQWKDRLPAQPFDLDFLVKVVEIALGDREVVGKVLAGESPAKATGWDLDGL
jgi:hypothetical protein